MLSPTPQVTSSPNSLEDFDRSSKSLDTFSTALLSVFPFITTVAAVVPFRVVAVFDGVVTSLSTLTVSTRTAAFFGAKKELVGFASVFDEDDADDADAAADDEGADDDVTARCPLFNIS
jgi:hypothetical protein